MKRSLIVFLGLCFLPAGAMAKFQPATPVVSQFVDTMTVTGVTVTSGTTVELTQMYETADQQWREIDIQNVDRSTNTIYVGESANLSTTEGTFSAGWEVIGTSSTATTGVSYFNPGSQFILNPGQRLYAICDKLSTSCKAVMKRMH